MWYRGKQIKIGLIVLTALVVILATLMTLSYHDMIAVDLPIFEEPPPPPAPEEEYVPNQIIVKFKVGTPIEAEGSLNESLGTAVIYTSPSTGFKVLQIPEGKTVAEMVALYSKQAIVEYAEPNYIEHILPEAK